MLSWGAGVCGDEITWKLYEDGRLVISGSGAMYDITASASPTGAQYLAPWSDYLDQITQVMIGEVSSTKRILWFY